MSTHDLVRNEFQFIDHIKSKYRLEKVGDDCAVLPKDAENDLLVTADLLVEDIDFRLEWTTPEFLGHKALAVSLSDIAAMGGEPKWALLSIGVSENMWKTDFLDRFYAGWHDLAGKYGVELVGGDVSRAPDRIVVDCVVGGEVCKGKAILRSGAKPGDALFVAGTLGTAAGGLKLLQKGLRLDPERSNDTQNLILKQLQPQPHVQLGNILNTRGLASSAIDVSDGLSSDLRHLCQASGVGAELVNLPVDRDLYSHFRDEEAVELALNGGEDFELLFTVPEEKIPEVEELEVFHIGTVTCDVGEIELMRGSEKLVLEPKGYQHFG